MEKETVRRFDGRCINSEFWVHTFTKKEYRILNREKEIEAYLKGKLPEEEKAKYESPRNWDCLTRFWEAAGKH